MLPSRLAYTKERLKRIPDSLDLSFMNVMGNSGASLPDHIVEKVPVIYYFFHGIPKIYKSQYTKKKVKEIIEQVKENTCI